MRCFYCMEQYNEEDYVICPFCGNDIGDLPSESFSLAAGSVLKDRYILGRVLGNGGFGITYIGYDKSLQRKIAVKEYFPTECASRQSGAVNVEPYGGERGERYAAGLESFTAEARRLANLTSIEGVVDVYDVFKENNTAYIVMEYLSGETVKEMLNRRKYLGFGTTMNIIVPVLQSLSKVHKEGLIHRDISPENIMRTNQGKIMLIDFGAARRNSLSVSKSLSVILKPGYAPIEQYDNKLDQASWTDVYATAATMYKMLTGVTPDNSNSRLLQDTLVPVSELNENLPKELDPILRRALAVKPEDRTQTAQEFLNELLTIKDPKKVKQQTAAKKSGKGAVTKTVVADTGGEPAKKAAASAPQKAKPPEQGKPRPSGSWQTYVHDRPISQANAADMEYKSNTLSGDRDNFKGKAAAVSTASETSAALEDKKPRTASKVSKPLIFITAVALVLLGVLVWVGYTDRQNNIEVPNFTSRSIDSVLSDSEYDFNFEVTYVYNPDTDLDVVISQSPESSTRRVSKDSTIHLTVNSLDTEVTVPVLSKLGQATAVSTLESLYLNSEIVLIHDDTVNEGCVVYTEPENGTKVKVLSTVTVYVAENSATVPYIVGMTYDDAVAELAESGLEINVVAYEYSTTYDAQCIISQEIDEGESAEKGSSVGVTVSLGAPYDVTIDETIDLSALDPMFKMVITCDGEEEASKTFYSFYFGNSSYGLSITRLNTTGTIPVNVYIDDELYMEYEFDFESGTATLVNTYEVSALDTGDDDEEEDTSTDSDTTSSRSENVTSGILSGTSELISPTSSDSDLEDETDSDL